jgi:CubicO group peptidase (beta-lactamase class C family)
MRFVLALAALLVGPVAAANGQIPITGNPQPSLAAFDRMMVQFLQQHHAVGASLAIARNGQLVYARGFGWADREAQQPVQPQSLFRLASVSKSITAVAIMRLVQDGVLHLDDHPFPILGLPPLIQPGVRPDPRLNQITVLQLLQHRGGFDRMLTPDPMYRPVLIARACGDPAPATPTDIIRYMEGRPLDFAPGARYSYSNFGYCVLGQLIGKVTGERYVDYVADKILEPLGVHSMRLGRSLLADRAPEEVKYYAGDNKMAASCFPPLGKLVAAPYGSFSLESHDSCGGWIGSAADLVKFQTAFDDPNHCPLLNSANVNRLFARPAGLLPVPAGRLASWVGCGWAVNEIAPGRFNISKTGAFVGTSSMMEHQPDGIDWAVVFNQDKDDQGAELSPTFSPVMHRIINTIQQWPGGVERGAEWP